MKVCLVCGRKLKDAESKRLGVGPKCKKKLGYDPEIMAELMEAGMEGIPVEGGIQLQIPVTPEERGELAT